MGIRPNLDDEEFDPYDESNESALEGNEGLGLRGFNTKIGGMLPSTTSFPVRYQDIWQRMEEPLDSRMKVASTRYEDLSLADLNRTFEVEVAPEDKEKCNPRTCGDRVLRPGSTWVHEAIIEYHRFTKLYIQDLLLLSPPGQCHYYSYIKGLSLQSSIQREDYYFI